ncbi:MAG: alanine--glyoxylate aminotransferase family protein [Alphaproteobacteria bacterium]|nr:alanine--glyoxylate aminotransferase family protein [Alphaproteobacteria bacterium]
MTMSDNDNLFGDLDPEPRLLMGPGPVDVYPRVLRAMSSPMLGQFDPQFTEYMNEVMALYRQVFRTKNDWTFLVDGTARAGIEACLTSLIAPGDKVLVPIFGRFGHLLTEICGRVGADVDTIETEWGTVFTPDQVVEAVRRHRPKLVAMVHGDTSTTMAQPLADIGPACRELGAVVYVDATATLGGNPLEVDEWALDAVSAGLQKCMSGPPGTAPVTINERVVEIIERRKHVEAGIRPDGFQDGDGPRIASNYFDLPMLMDYWSPKRLNHHTEATSMLYAARECARVVLGEGLADGFKRHAITGRALRAGLEAMGLSLFGDPRHRMANVTGVVIPENVDGEAIRSAMLADFGIEIGTSFGPLHGKIWRIGTMGYVCRKANVMRCLSALETLLRRAGVAVAAGAGTDAAYAVYEGETT